MHAYILVTEGKSGRFTYSNLYTPTLQDFKVMYLLEYHINTWPHAHSHAYVHARTQGLFSLYTVSY